MVYSLTYRRPPHVESSRSSINGYEKPESVSSGSTTGSAGIPDALSFDRVITGGTCPPCTTRDFMNYLIYIEHAAENLQFYLWYQDYCKRFADLPASEKALSPEWSMEKLEAEAQQTTPAPTGTKGTSTEAAAIFKDTDFAQAKVHVAEVNPFHTPPRTPDLPRHSVVPSEYGWSDSGSTLQSTKRSDFQQKAASAFEAADVKLQPFTIQPFRTELTRIIATYISDNSPRQLNLASQERAALLRTLASTTHPSAFGRVLHTIEWTLRHQAHPNFVRWTICNGNRPRVIFARGLGVAGISLGLLTGVLLALSGARRAWRVLAALGLVVGIATLVAAWKGMCVVLHGLHHRHLRPWELFADDDDPVASASSSSSSAYELKNASFDSIGSGNSYESEPWLAKYEKRNLLRKVFDREVWIQEPALRQIQDTIFLQAFLAGLLGTACVVGVLVAVPAGRFF